MKVFISWSGILSRRAAETLREWLPNVLQAVEPWMSAEDIEKGARWSSEVATELSSTKAGILCVTPDNLEAPWLNFEAGALSKTLEKTFVSPYLINLRPSDLKGPLVQFQATEANKLDTRRLVGTLNKALDDSALSEKQLDKTFEIWWPELESSLQEIRSAKAPQRPQRADREILEEILALVRDQAKRNPVEILFTPTFSQEEPFTVSLSPGSGKSHILTRMFRPGENVILSNSELNKLLNKGEQKPAEQAAGAEATAKQESDTPKSKKKRDA